MDAVKSTRLRRKSNFFISCKYRFSKAKTQFFVSKRVVVNLF
jgi:hypothetical protein